MRSAISIVVILVAAGLLPSGAGAQDWRAALENEKAKNAQRLSVIDTEGAPVAKSLRAVTAQVDAHNANPPDERSESAVNAYNARAETLNTQRDSLRTRLQALVDEQDRLKARNDEIERKLRCVQLPVACTAHSDCECSNSCGDLGTAGRGEMRVCQPRR